MTDQDKLRDRIKHLVDETDDGESAAQAIIDDLGLTTVEVRTHAGPDTGGAPIRQSRVVGKWITVDADPAPHVYRPNPDTRVPRLKACVDEWPDCEEGEYHPSCCRFPKSCSCTVYDPEQVSPEDLEDLP